MKHIFLFNALLINLLSISAQNLVNLDANYGNLINQQINYNDNPYIQNNIKQRENRGGSNTVQRLTTNKIVNDDNNISNNNRGTSNKLVNENVKQLNNVGNVFNQQRIVVNDAPIEKNLNRSVLINVVSTENNNLVQQHEVFNMPKTLLGKNKSDGVKIKKSIQKTFSPTITKKTIVKRKPRFKKIKYQTYKCPKW